MMQNARQSSYASRPSQQLLKQNQENEVISQIPKHSPQIRGGFLASALDAPFLLSYCARNEGFLAVVLARAQDPEGSSPPASASPQCAACLNEVRTFKSGFRIYHL